MTVAGPSPDVGVRLGVVATDRRNPLEWQGHPFGVTLDDLCTSCLVVGPTGSGKTAGVASPLVSFLLAQVQQRAASVVVLDPKGDDFASAGRYDHRIDLQAETSAGFDLFGGAQGHSDVEVAAAAERLAEALLPRASEATAFYISSAKNALYYVLAPFAAANPDRWPTIRELLDLLTNPTGGHWQSVRDRLKHLGLDKAYQYEFDRRSRQLGRREDPAASLVETLAELDRPHLRRIFESARPRFAMRAIDEPTAVHVALPRAHSPTAVQVLARLAISQFVQVVSARATNQQIYKVLVCDEASSFLDEYVTAGVRIIRSRRAGMVLLTQSLADIPRELRPSLFGSIGGKIAFPGLGPEDARVFSDYWGTRQSTDRSVSTGGAVEDGRGRLQEATPRQTLRTVERPAWSPSELSNELPYLHCVASLTTLHGWRKPPLLVNLDRSARPR